MTGRGDRAAGAAGGPLRHVPVLLAEVCAALGAERGGLFLDGTFGAGGYAAALLAASDRNHVIGIDRDPEAIAGGAPLVAASAGRLTLVLGQFGELDRLAAAAGHDKVDGIALDIGVSSMQLDRPERGFSFRLDGPLDMRMQRAGRSAADLVNGASEGELADIFYHFGEERRSRAIAHAIVERRRRGRIDSTLQLAEIVAGLVRAEPGGAHPATRVFQALRIAVNDELRELVAALHAAERALKPGGRLAVVTFHSLEDRIVKQFFAARAGRSPGGSRHLPPEERAAPTFTAVTRGPVRPSEDEVARNARARSAKLRAAERTQAPAQPPLAALSDLAELPRTSEKRGARA